MTANHAKITQMLANLREYKAQLQRIAETTEQAFLDDPRSIGAARYYLQTAIQCCIDLANHIVAANHYRPPSSYRDAFVILCENQIVPEDFLPTLQNMVGLRQRLVHDYPRVDDRIIYGIIARQLGDFDRFAECVAAPACGGP